MQVFYSDSHRQHNPPFEVIDGGQRAPYLEDPGRLNSILAALQPTGWADIAEPSGFPLEAILTVHTADYLDFLAEAWGHWLAAYPDQQDATADSVLLPATFALRRTPHRPASLLGRAGYHMMDLSAVIVDGTYQAALGAAHCALSAARSILDSAPAARCAFSLSRPPGHHAGPDYAAGYCFINNAAVAAQSLAAHGRVAILDIDYHAGNGTQDIFYERSGVLTISLHADPAMEYPYYAGYADETGAAEGLGFHHNFPLPAGADDEHYLGVLDRALEIINAYSPRHLVVSAGMDIYEKDSLGRFKVTTDGIGRIGERIARLKLPTIIILEGGYNNADLGRNVVALLSPFAS